MAAALDVVAFPECDDAKTGEGDHRRTCRQTVKSIRQIHCVGPCGHQEIHPDDEQDDGYDTAGEVEVEERLSMKLMPACALGNPDLVGISSASTA